MYMTIKYIYKNRLIELEVKLGKIVETIFSARDKGAEIIQVGDKCYG